MISSVSSHRKSVSNSAWRDTSYFTSPSSHLSHTNIYTSVQVKHRGLYKTHKKRICSTLFCLSRTNTCSHKDTLLTALPGIFKVCFFIAFRGSWGLAERGKQFCDQCETVCTHHHAIRHTRTHKSALRTVK